ncbi:hypothetical protein B0H67DRAFT_552711 [Lasiosphaeris hirsuta]|uniref:Extracellular membrane protein CFEM domain-containing protein n=1 Tax=Lasiosphaeris hirsuta TaxID=260670 RepID=A0AA40ARC0_9PEZI|nr:hypothetical protein B0H67DRAFT_552711 [Lasiosphaeris hirsuta]
MANKPFLCLVLLWTTTLMAGARAASPTNISSEILNFAPACAQQCFRSFIQANFNTGDCGDSPSMQCLCRLTGSSGYTLGEGAVSCIVAESTRGICKGTDANVGTTATAYNMCVGIAGAAQKTHETIVATLVVPSGTGPLVVPTVTQTSGTSATPIVVTTSSSVPLTTTTSATTEPTAVAPTPVQSNDATSTAIPEQANASGRQPLSSAQITGIALGCAAVVVLGILLIFLAKCVRRRRYGDLETGFSRMRDSLSRGRKSQANSPPTIQISDPIHDTPAEVDFRRPAQPQVQPQMGRPGGIGLAISPSPYSRTPAPGYTATASSVQKPLPVRAPTPPTKAATPKIEREVQRSPPKPALTLAIPGTLPSAPRVRPPVNGRDSVVTEFAEDGEGDSASGNIWRPPATDPQSATAYFFADKGGNWVLRNKSTTRKPESTIVSMGTEVELPSPQDQTKAERAQGFNGWFSPGAVVSPLRVPSRPEQAKLGSPIAFKDQRRDNRSSSVYSPFTAPQSITPGPENPLPKDLPPPDTYFSMIKDGRELAGNSSKTKRKSARKANRRRSQDSVTSIESGAAPPFEEEDLIDDELQVDLSPVAESPRTPSTPGRSPVSYPKIHNRSNGRQQQQTRGYGANLSPFPAREGPLRPPLSLTPGPQRLMNAPALNPAPNRNPGQQRNGSPEARQGTIPTVGQQQQRRQEQPQSSAQYWNDQPQQQLQRSAQGSRRQPSRSPPPYDAPMEGIASRQQQAYWDQGQRQQPQPQRQSWRPTPPMQQPQARPVPPPAELSAQQSSLLAKRLGAEKAAALALAAKGTTADGKERKQRPGWTREGAAPPVQQVASQRQVQIQNPAQAQIQAQAQFQMQAQRQAQMQPQAQVQAQAQAQRQAQMQRQMQPGSSSLPFRGPLPDRRPGLGGMQLTTSGLPAPTAQVLDMPIPITPGWVPELTPTRKGDDLFLNVR